MSATSSSSTSKPIVTPRQNADLRQRDWLMGIESAFDTVQFLAYSPHKDIILFGYDFGSDSNVAELLSEAHKSIGNGKFTEALLSVQKVLAKNVNLVCALVLQGYIFLQMKNYDNSLRSLSEAIKETNGLAVLWHAKGTIFMSMGSFSESAECYERAISRSFFEKAIRSFQAAHKIAPDDLRPYPLMARALHANNDLDKSIEVYDAYLSLVRIEWIYYLKASVLYDKSDYDGALKFCTLIRDDALRTKADELIQKCRKKVLPRDVFDPKVAVHNAFLVSSMVSPRFEDDDDKHKMTKIDEKDEDETSIKQEEPSPLERKSSKKLSSRVSKMFNFNKGDTKKSSPTKTSSEKGKGKDKVKDKKGRKKSASAPDLSISESAVSISEVEAEPLVDDPRTREYTLADIVADSVFDELFTEICKKNHCEENFEFYKAVLDYDELEDPGERRLAGVTINRNYVELGSANEMNLLDEVRSAALNKERLGEKHLFADAQKAASDLLYPYLIEFQNKLIELVEQEESEMAKSKKSPKFSLKVKRTRRTSDAIGTKGSPKPNPLSGSSSTGDLDRPSTPKSAKGKDHGKGTGKQHSPPKKGTHSPPKGSPKSVESEDMSSSSDDDKNKVVMIKAPSFFEVPTAISRTADSTSTNAEKSNKDIEVIHVKRTKDPSAGNGLHLNLAVEESDKNEKEKENEKNDKEKESQARIDSARTLMSSPRAKIETPSEVRLILEDFKSGDGTVFTKFFEYCEKESVDGPLRFYQRVHAFEQIDNAILRKTTSHEIEATFLYADSRWPIKLTPQIAGELAKNLEECPKTLFRTAVDHALDQIIPTVRKFKSDNTKRLSLRLLQGALVSKKPNE